MRVLFFVLSEELKVYKVIYNSSDQTKRYEKVFVVALAQLLPSQKVNSGPIESENGDTQKVFKSASRLLNTVGIKNLLANRIPKLKQVGIILCIPYLLRIVSQSTTRLKIYIMLLSNSNKEFLKEPICNQVFFQNFFEYLFKLSNLIPLLIIDIKRYLHDQSVLFTVSGDINFGTKRRSYY